MEKIPMEVNRYTLDVASQVNSICQPFFDKFNISFFDFTRVHDNGTEIVLASNPELIQSVYKNGLYTLPGNGKFLNKKKNVLLLSSSVENSVNFCFLNHIRENFAVDHFLMIIEKNDHHLDCYSFGANFKDHQMINFYMSNLDVFEKFILYFKSTASFLIKKADNFRMTLPILLKPFYNDILAYSDQQEIDNMKFMCKMISDLKLELPVNNTIIKLSKRETECVLYLTSGLSVKEIAKRLSLSPRTVETYIQNIKNKLNCDKISQISDLIFDYAKILR